MVVVDIRTPEGYVAFCRLLISEDEQIARQVFGRLKGTADDGIVLPLRISLIRPPGVEDKVIARRYCTLDELVWNYRSITKDVFKHLSLDNLLYLY